MLWILIIFSPRYTQTPSFLPNKPPTFISCFQPTEFNYGCLRECEWGALFIGTRTTYQCVCHYRKWHALPWICNLSQTLMSPSLRHNEMPVGSVLSWSCRGKHSHRELTSTMALSSPEDCLAALLKWTRLHFFCFKGHCWILRNNTLVLSPWIPDESVLPVAMWFP